VNGAEQDAIVQYLHRLDEKVDRVRDDLHEINQRLSSVEASVARLHDCLTEIRPGRPTHRG
jgi:predicted nuclease with TOPRIM domain